MEDMLWRMNPYQAFHVRPRNRKVPILLQCVIQVRHGHDGPPAIGHKESIVRTVQIGEHDEQAAQDGVLRERRINDGFVLVCVLTFRLKYYAFHLP